MARSLLLFKHGQVLNDLGLEHLKVYTANCYGLDKLSYNKRLKWTNDNLDKIISGPESCDGAMPYGGVGVNLSDSKYVFKSLLQPSTTEFYNFILEANEALLFLSCCTELKNYFADPNRFISRLPIYLDATCSGLQHLSAMISDTNLAKYVNISKSSKEDIPADVYSYMIKFVEAKINRKIAEDPYFAVLGNIHITRKLIKPGIMTISYGATSRGIAEQIKNTHFKPVDPVKGKKLTFVLITNELNKTKFDIYLELKQLAALGKAIHSSLYEEFPNLTILVKYLKDINKMLKKINIPTI